MMPKSCRTQSSGCGYGRGPLRPLPNGPTDLRKLTTFPSKSMQLRQAAGLRHPTTTVVAVYSLPMNGMATNIAGQTNAQAYKQKRNSELSQFAPHHKRHRGCRRGRATWRGSTSRIPLCLLTFHCPTFQSCFQATHVFLLGRL